MSIVVVDHDLTGLDGSFDFLGLDAEKTYRLRWPYRYKADPIRFEIDEGEELEPIVIEAREVGAITGYVRHPDGSAVSGMQIMRKYSFGSTASELATSDENGRYGFSHDGGFCIFYASGMNQAIRSDYLVRVSFDIRDARGNELGMANFISVVHDVVNDRGGRRASRGSSRSSTMQVHPRTHWFVIVKDGYTADVQYLEITEDSEEILITLGEAGSIFGRIGTNRGCLVSVMPLEIWQLLGEPYQTWRVGNRSRMPFEFEIGEALAQGARTDADGYFTLSYLPAGWYVVMTNDGVSEPVEVLAGYETGPIRFGGDSAE